MRGPFVIFVTQGVLLVEYRAAVRNCLRCESGGNEGEIADAKRVRAARKSGHY